MREGKKTPRDPLSRCRASSLFGETHLGGSAMGLVQH